MNKKEIIFKTTLELVNEFGLIGTTISKISKRANISPGIIYHYFNSKDEIIHQLYKNVEEDFAREINKDNPLNLSILDCYKQIWISAYNFCIQNYKKMVFIEIYQNSPYFKDCISTARREFLEMLSKKNEESIMKGELKDLPIESIYAMTGRVAIELARLHIKGLNPLKSNSIEDMAESICRSILI
ncbi:MAG: TetR/AcrR family transcriptional regulator [Clostridia bacterium]|nr:TetR/AcrR family transcriptional regulator [Clostridia bacterium]